MDTQKYIIFNFWLCSEFFAISLSIWASQLHILILLVKQYLVMAVREITDDNHFQAELQAAGIKLVVVDFTASW